jgi:hypothetical protein
LTKQITIAGIRSGGGDHVNEWPTRAKAEYLRQWPLIVHAAERAAAMPELDEAWARRIEFEAAATLYAWDVRIESDGDAASHKWITQDIVKVECGFADAARSAMQLAQPYAVIVGDESVATRFPPLEPVPGDVLEAYAQELRAKGMVPEVEIHYGELRRALRQVMSRDHV